MKTRTIIVSSLFIVYSLMMFWGAITVVVQVADRGYSVWMYRDILIWALQWPIWIGFLKKKIWAWWVLVAIFILMVPESIWNIWKFVVSWSCTFHSLPAVWSRPFSQKWFYLLLALLEFLAPPTLALWILITDKPSTWHSTVNTRQFMSPCVKILLGVVTCCPILLLLGSELIINVLPVSDIHGVPSSTVQWVAYSALLFIIAGFLSFMLLVYYILHVSNNEEISSHKKFLWKAILVLGNILAMPIYWYKYVWHKLEV